LKQVIPSNEIGFHPLSFQDEAGRLFEWRGEIYRAIAGSAAPFYRRLFESDAGRELIAERLIVPTEVTPFAVEGYDLVLQHQRLPFASYPFEWPPAMFKAACLAIIDLALALSRHDLALKDAHPWNVLFDGVQPYWVDITSIIPGNGGAGWPAVHEFDNECLRPLLLMAHGREKFARALIVNEGAVEERDLELLGGSSSVLRDLLTAQASHLPPNAQRLARKVLRRIRPFFGKVGNQPSTPLAAIRRTVEKIEVPFEQLPRLQAIGAPDDNWTAKQRCVHQILEEKKPRTLLDVAAGDGWFSLLAAESGSRVVAFESDSEAAGRLFAKARAGHPWILPLIIDFTRPTPARGLSNHSQIAATERFRCEMVLFLGFLHDLVFRYRRLGLNEIADGIALSSSRWAVVEFIPPNDPEIGSLWSGWFAGYSLDNLLIALRRHFPKIDQHSSTPAGRVLLLCEK